MRLMITGAQGYVGARVASLLAARGHRVTALVGSSEQRPSTGQPSLVGRLEAPTEVAARMADYDGIGHFAAAQSPEFSAINARFVEAVLSRMSRGQVFAMQSGSLVFGSTGTRVIDELAPLSPPPFLVERASLEQSVIQAGDTGPQTSIIYAAMVHGGRGAMIPVTLVDASRRAGRVVYPGNGEQSWSTVHVDDWVQLIVAALEAQSSGGQRYFAAGPLMTIRELAENCALALALPAPRHGTDEEVGEAYGFFAGALAMDQRLSGQKAARTLGWTAHRNDVKQSFADFNR